MTRLIPRLSPFGNYALAAGAVFAVILFFAPVRDSNPAGTDIAMAERIQRIDDEKEIRDLMVQYGRHLDSLDFEAYSRLFAEEGEWSGQVGDFDPIKGPEAIRTTMEQAFADRTYDPAHVTNLHLISNERIEIDGDRATGYSRWTVLSRNDDDEPYVRLSGHYDDVYIREDGQWKFLSRIARREIP